MTRLNETMPQTAMEAALLVKRRSMLAEVLVKLVTEKPLGLIGALIIVALVVVAALAPWIAPYDPNGMSAADRLKPPGNQFLFGTDNFGRDVLSRIIWGARVSLFVGLGAVAIGSTLASTIGIISGYLGGKVDIVVQRVIDILMAFPGFIFLLTLMAIVGQGLVQVTVVIGIYLSISPSRVVRGAALSVRENQYFESARAIGCRHPRIVLAYVLPNVFPIIIILMSLGIGQAIISEASLSFLGLGIPPPWPSWGGMLSGQSRAYFLTAAPWMALFPGIALSLAVFGFNMLGDALRDLMDPRLRGSGKNRV